MKCEFCKTRNVRSDSRMCAICTNEIDCQWEKDEEARRVKAAKRKCNRCQVPLKPTRHFNCEDCVPVDSDPTYAGRGGFTAHNIFGPQGPRYFAKGIGGIGTKEG